MRQLLRLLALCAALRSVVAQVPNCANSGAEPTWLRSSWWPSGAVFRCGCGFVNGGAASAWNDVTICAALGDIYYATGGPQWLQMLGAPPAPGFSDCASGAGYDYCNFNYGGTLKCSFATTGIGSALGPGAILNLAANTMTGTLPASFMNLAAISDMTSITFTGNSDLVIDPALFAPFTSLTRLSLSSTQLSGSLPASWGALSNLLWFDASTSGLSGTLPPVLSVMTGLSALFLDSNALTGSIPTTFSSLTALKTLMLSTNTLSGSLSLATLCGMTALTYLDVSSNGISGTIPDISCMRNIDRLDLRNNQLTGVIPHTLVVAMKCNSTPQASALASALPPQLGLAGNMLTGVVPVDINNGGCQELAAQRPVSVCLAGSSEQSGGTSFIRFGTATCEPCADGFFSSSPGAVACTACEPGYYSFTNHTGCQPCEAGQFLGKSGSCEACAPGSSSGRGAVACQACQANTYSAADGASCISCPAASTSYVGSPTLASCTCGLGAVPQYGSDNSTFTCVQCGRGSFHDVAAGACVRCAAGTYSSSTGSFSCTPAASGFFIILDGADQSPCPVGTFLNGTSCANCAPGTFAASAGATGCPACPPSTFAASFAATACDACPANSRASDDRTVCLCSEGYYDATRGASDGPDCVACAEGGACVGGELLAQEGYWRETPGDDIFLKCREGYCLPEEAATAAPAGRRLQQINSTQQTSNCADGHSGTLCAICLDGYTMQGGFCQPCGAGDDWAHWSKASRGVIIAFFVPAGLLLITLLLLLPLLPSWERLMWRVTTALAGVAGGLLGMAGAAKRKCFAGDADEADDVAPPRRASTRIPRRSTGGQWSMLPFHQQPSVRFSTVAEAAPAEGEAEAEAEAPGQGSIDELLEAAAGLLIALMRPGKILINFYQIVSTFIDTLDVPWPRTFATIMSRVNIVNVNFLSLPKTACLYPNTPFYRTFHGYTLGTVMGLAVIAASWLVGQRLLAPRTLRDAPEAERAHRLRRFQTLCLSRALLLLYLVYPGVSGVVIAVFNCRDLPSGRSVLVADHRETCWTAKHWSFVGAGIFWVIVVPFGIPMSFLALLYYFRVPHLARAKVANAWLGEAVEHVWRLGVPQPAVDVQNLGFDNISDEHLELLVAVLVHGEIPAPAGEDGGAAGKARLSTLRMSMRLSSAPRGSLLHRMRHAVKCRGSGEADGETHRPVHRAALQKKLLHWCETSATLSLPPLAWAEAEDEAPPEESSDVCDAPPPKASALRRTFSTFSTAALTASSRAELAALEQRALRKVGFLFESYTVQCWPWEVVELGRKLILTSILALVVPGSATQVTVGVLVAFAMLLLFQRHRPYAAPGMTFVASVAQVNLFVFLFVGLLLKVRLNGDATDSKLFNAIVTILSVVPVALPVALKATSYVAGMDGDELQDAMDEAEEDAVGGDEASG